MLGLSHLADVLCVDLGLDVFRKLSAQRVVVLQALSFLPVQPLAGAKHTNTLLTNMTNFLSNSFPYSNNTSLTKTTAS